MPAGHGDGGQPPTMSTRRGGPAPPRPCSATVGFAPAVAMLIPCLATALLSSLAARIMSTRRGGPAPPGRLRPGGAPYGGGHAPPGSCGGASSSLAPPPCTMAGSSSGGGGRGRRRRTSSVCAWWSGNRRAAGTGACACYGVSLVGAGGGGRGGAEGRRGRGEVEGALCVGAGFTAARCSQAQQHAGEVKAAWEFESIVMLVAASQLEGVAFQRWDIHGVRPRSTAAGASSALVHCGWWFRPTFILAEIPAPSSLLNLLRGTSATRGCSIHLLQRPFLAGHPHSLCLPRTWCLLLAWVAGC